MRKLKLSLLTLGVLVSGFSWGQSAEDIYRISFKNRASGTARSAAMGGAFTSLGADPSSMNINPAGLGMYRSSEVSITPSIFMSRVSLNSMQENTASILTKDNRTTASVNNMSAVFNLFNNDYTTMRGFTLGISYYNDRYSRYSSHSKSAPSNRSMIDYFARQLEGIKQSAIDNVSMSDQLAVYRNASPGLWGAMMAFNNVLLDPDPNKENAYYINPDNTLAKSDYVLPSQRVKQRTTIDNFSFSAGTNFGDIVYFGLTMGARMYEYSRESAYEEYGAAGNAGQFGDMIYRQYNTVSGNAFDFKLGTTIEPVDGLKVGIAYHFPTISFMEDEYSGSMDVLYKDSNKPYYQSTPYDINNYDVKSAPALLAGISYRFPYGIISLDYQRSWYNKMEVRNMGYGTAEFNREIVDTYKAADSFMAGVEIQPAQGFFVRGGYAYYGSALKYEEKKYGSTQNISFGLGYRSNFFYVDLAYINTTYKGLLYKYYGDNFTDPLASESTIKPKFSDNTLSLTLGFRF